MTRGEPPVLALLVASLAGCHLFFPFATDEAPALLDAAPDVVHLDTQGPRDGSGEHDRPRDGPVAQESPTKPDGPKPDQQPGDAGVVPGTWVTIAKAILVMGSPSSEPCRFFNEDLHQVSLTHPFAIQTTEVTQGQFQALLGYNPSDFGPGGTRASCGTDCPVESVSWHEAAAYCNALSGKAGLTKCYTCSGSAKNVACQDGPAYIKEKIYTCPGYRLPTEAEWELAYRSGSMSAYVTGSNEANKCSTCLVTDANASQVGWYCANSVDTIHKVGLKQPNPWGLFDMAGNVWEWCHDWYQDSLGSLSVSDPWGSASGATRVLRGGSWYSYAPSLRAATRFGDSPQLGANTRGFRCVKTK